MNTYWTCNEKGYLFSWSIECPQWTDIKAELDMLTAEGKAEWTGKGYLIPHEAAAAFNREERELLTLPDVYPYQMAVLPNKTMRDADFRIRIEFRDFADRPFMNPQVTGSCICLYGDAYYMFDSMQFELIRLANVCHADTDGMKTAGEIIAYNLRCIAKIKDYAGVLRADVDETFKQYHIISPEYLSISIEESKNPKDAEKPYYAVPLLLNEEGCRYGEDVQNQFREQFVEKLHPDLHYHQRNKETKQRTDFVFSKEQKEGLEQVKRKGHMNREEARQLILSPEKFFPLRIFLFDRDDYSRRVIGYGTFLSKIYPYLKGLEGSWLPEEGESTFSFAAKEANGTVDELEITPENAGDIAEKIKKVMIQGPRSAIHTIQYDNRTILVTRALVKKVNAALKEAGNSTIEYPVKALGQVGEGKKNLISERNEERANYQVTAESLQKKREEQRRKSISIDCLLGNLLGIRSEISLYDYQKKGVQWMLKNWLDGYNGVLLADDMGLGKTLQVLAFLSQVKEAFGKRDMPSVLIVAPVALLNNWMEEYAKFVKNGIFADIVKLAGNHFKQKYPLRRHGKDVYYDFSAIASNHIVLTTYETLRGYDTSFGRLMWSVLVLDEAQKIKNPGAGVTNAVKSMTYQFGLAVTGTPVENAWLDLWSIMDFVDPGKLEGMKEFREYFQNRLKFIRKDPEAIRKLGEELERRLAPLFLRRHKADCLEGMPEKFIIPQMVPMTKEQKNQYEQVMEKGRKVKGQKGAMLKVIAALRDVSLCPYLVTEEEKSIAARTPEEFFGSSGRLKALLQILMNIKVKNEKVLLFITSRKMQRLVKGFLEKIFQIHIPTPINGEMSGEKRLAVVKEFNQAQGFGILILSAEAGGVGLNIIGANNVIHLSRCWNPAKEDQATDRAYRIGQKKPVHVYLPMSIWDLDKKGASFDEKMEELLEFKRTLSKSAIFPAGEFEEDCLDLYKNLFDDPRNAENSSRGGVKREYWTGSKIKNVKGRVLEEVVAGIYDRIDGYHTELTPVTNDYGGDVIVYKNRDRTEGMLIQCKRRPPEERLGLQAVQEVFAALPKYQKSLGCRLKGVVVTNAAGFTDNAKELAAADGVQLIDGVLLEKMLERYPVPIV